MGINKIISSRIKGLMDSNNTSIRELAGIIGVSHPTMSSYVSGKNVIDSEKLFSVSRYYNKPLQFFLNEDYYEPKFLFRSDKALQDIDSKTSIEIKGLLDDYVDIVDNKIIYKPQSFKILVEGKKLLKKDFNVIENISLRQRNDLDIATFIPENYFKTLENSGINVVSRSFDNTKFFGASSFSEEYGSFIIVNDNEKITEERKIFSLIHEYGHLLFNCDDYSNDDFIELYQNYRNDLSEKIVDSFAGYFLMPKLLVNSYIEERNYNVNVYEMKKYFKVSIQTLYLMLNRYGLITKDDINDFYRVLHKNGWKHSEPDPIDGLRIEDKNYKLVQYIKQLYEDGDITIGKISKVLGLENTSSRMLLKKWNESFEQSIRFE